mmetsp:Transcript_85544/g.138701  ORF Transcript_85544/g.138701 Transcript_85544/m.138701 type:complete len:114 (+) Transcript_85544:244-585(+)
MSIDPPRSSSSCMKAGRFSSTIFGRLFESLFHSIDFLQSRLLHHAASFCAFPVGTLRAKLDDVALRISCEADRLYAVKLCHLFPDEKFAGSDIDENRLVALMRSAYCAVLGRF